MAGIRSWFASRLLKALDAGSLQDYIRYAYGGADSSAGIIVNPQTAMQAASVYACIKVLAESIAQLSIELFTGDAIKGKTPNDGDGLLDLLRYQPNEWQTSTEFMEMMVTHLNLRGNAYAYVTRTTRGRVVEMIPLHPDFVQVTQESTNGAAWKIVYRASTNGGGMYMFDASEILHVRGLTMNGYMGISPIAYAREAIGLALATEQFGSRLFKNGAKMSGILTHPGTPSRDMVQMISDSFDSQSSGENAHRTALLTGGMTFEKISMTPDDSQFLDTRKYQRTEIAGLFRVPPHKIGDLERATFSNIEQQSLDFATYSLAPWCKRIELAVRRCVFTQKQRDAGLTAKFNLRELLRGDSAATSAYLTSGINAGWLTRNEARAIEDYNPIDGLDEPLRPLNMVENDDVPEPAGDADTGALPGAPIPARVAGAPKLSIAKGIENGPA